MQRDFGTAFITQCAPVMAGLKPANLFRWVEQDTRRMDQILAVWRAELRPRGVCIRVLKHCPHTRAFLVYAFRPKRLWDILCRDDVVAYLRGAGYTDAPDADGYLEQLSRRLCTEEAFPHEIGVFLGYPLEDVVGFVENKGKNYTCKGYWKAYGDPEAARARFDSYRKCTEVYLRCYQGGTPASRLTVAV